MKKLNKSQIIGLAVIFAAVLFIWGNSLFPKKESAQISDNIKEIVVKIIGEETPPARFIGDNIRKIGHFIEFAILGTATALLFRLEKRKKTQSAANQLFFGFSVAAIDETIQIFSGRGSALPDVWLDLAGFALFAFAVHLVTGIKNRLVGKRR